MKLYYANSGNYIFRARKFLRFEHIYFEAVAMFFEDSRGCFWPRSSGNGRRRFSRYLIHLQWQKWETSIFNHNHHNSFVSLNMTKN